MARIITKIGDVYSANIGFNKKKYFQYIANDLTQLNSNVIRGFKKEYSIDDKPNLMEIIRDEVSFYAHCMIRLGIKMNFWEKIGNIKDIGDFQNILFKLTNDALRKVGEPMITKSNNWYVWKINQPFKTIGAMTEKYKAADIGFVINPRGIVEKLKGNKYPIEYPE